MEAEIRAKKKKRRVLFVDDEKRVLDGLRRMLRPFRKSLELHFALNGKDALELMNDKKFDVVVSDMRMPGMDGAEFLMKVKERYPETMRIILTGQTSQEATLRAIGIAHQFLDKPCEPEKLKYVLERAVFIKKLMTHPKLEKIVAGIGALPPLPDIYKEIQTKLSDPDVSIQEIAEIIEKDISMSAKILQLVNSAFFGHFSHVESPEKAVHLLGLETIKSIVLTLRIFEQYEGIENMPFSMKDLWMHSLRVGQLSRLIAGSMTEKQSIIDDAFIAGMLHDIGKLLLGVNKPQKYQDALELAENESISIYEAETRLFGAGHAEIGGYLIGLWGLPGPVIEAIVYHHRPQKYPSKEFDALTAVLAADFLEHEKHPENKIGNPSPIQEKHFEKIGCLEKFDEWQRIRDEGEELKDEL